MKNCKFCNKVLNRKNKIYCNNKCQNDFKHKEYILNWKKGINNGLRGKFYLSKHIRRHLLEKFNHSCSKCSWNKLNPITNLSPLEVHHIDGNSLNNEEHNLDLLCPNCHSLTHNFKALNQNSKRVRN